MYLPTSSTTGRWATGSGRSSPPGFVVEDVIEPEWPEGFTGVWGQWSPERGEIFPGTAIFVSRLPG